MNKKIVTIFAAIVILCLLIVWWIFKPKTAKIPEPTKIPETAKVPKLPTTSRVEAPATVPKVEIPITTPVDFWWAGTWIDAWSPNAVVTIDGGVLKHNGNIIPASVERLYTLVTPDARGELKDGIILWSNGNFWYKKNGMYNWNGEWDNPAGPVTYVKTSLVGNNLTISAGLSKANGIVDGHVVKVAEWQQEGIFDGRRIYWKNNIIWTKI